MNEDDEKTPTSPRELIRFLSKKPAEIGPKSLVPLGWVISICCGLGMLVVHLEFDSLHRDNEDTRNMLLQTEKLYVTEQQARLWINWERDRNPNVHWFDLPEKTASEMGMTDSTNFDNEP